MAEDLYKIIDIVELFKLATFPSDISRNYIDNIMPV